MLAEVRRLAKIIDQPAPISANPDHDIMLAPAAEAGAYLIVYGNAALAFLTSHTGNPIVTRGQAPALAIIAATRW
jgi:hypothetical protein